MLPKTLKLVRTRRNERKKERKKERTEDVSSGKRARAEARVHLSYTSVTKFYLVILLYGGGV